MNIAEKLTKVSENTEKVFEAGRTAEWSDFWDSWQQNGERKGYGSAFVNWSDDMFYPKYNIENGGYWGMIFQSCKCTDLMKRCEECGIEINTKGVTSMKAAFQSCLSTTLPKVYLTSTVYVDDTSSAFQGIVAETLEIVVNNKTAFNSNAFMLAYNLKNLIIEGEIGKSGLDLTSCTALTHESLMNVINCLVDYSEDTSGNVYKVTFYTTNMKKLTDEEKAMATEKGWTLA